MTTDNKISERGKPPALLSGQAGASDPLGAMIAMLPPDPLIGDFVALRESQPDLHELAFRTAAHQAELIKLLSFKHVKEIPDHRAVVAGLELLGNAYRAQVALWPTDYGDDAEAKVSLHRPRHEAARVRATNARLIRIELAALNPGFTIVLPVPLPSIRDRALDDHAPWAIDLPARIADLPADASYSLAHHHVLAKLGSTEPDLDSFAKKAMSYFVLAMGLQMQAARIGQDQAQLRLAFEGALIAAYTLCCQVGLWPARKGTSDMEAKTTVQLLINGRATSSDPLHMQAAVRMCFSAGERVARHAGWRFDRTPLPEPWAENI